MPSLNAKAKTVHFDAQCLFQINKKHPEKWQQKWKNPIFLDVYLKYSLNQQVLNIYSAEISTKKSFIFVYKMLLILLLNATDYLIFFLNIT